MISIRQKNPLLNRVVQHRFALTITSLSVALYMPSACALDLREASLLGLKNDPQYASAQANYKAIQERVPQARAALLPTLNWTAGTNFTLSKNNGSNSTGEINDLTRASQTNTVSDSNSTSTTDANTNTASSSSTNNTNTTTSSSLQESSTIGNTSDGWTEPRQTNRNRSLTTGLSFSLPLYRPVSNAQLEQSKLLVSQAEIQLQAAKSDMLVRVAQAYFDVVIAEENIIAISAQKRATVEQLASAKHNFEVGTTTITDTHEAQARFDLVKAQEINAANELKVKTSALRAVIGTLPGSVWRLKPGSLDLAAPTPALIDAWVNLAERGAYAVLIQKMGVQMAQKEIEKQNAAYKPTLDFVANAGITRANARNLTESSGVNNLLSVNQGTNNSTSQANTGSSASTTIGSSATGTGVTASTTSTNSGSSTATQGNQNTNTASQTATNYANNWTNSRSFEKNAFIGIQFVMPLYQGGLYDSRVREAIALQDKVRADLETALANATLTVNQSFYGVISSLAQVTAFEAAETSSSMAVDSNKLGYEVGLRLNIDVLNAQQQLFATRRDLARARVDTLLNGLRLKAAVGSLEDADIQSVNQWLVPAK